MKDSQVDRRIGWSEWGLLIAICVMGALVRVYRLGEVPGGLFCDEAALGYNAFTLANWGRDEHGVMLPAFVWSFGGYKNPIFIYVCAIFVKILGLSEFSTRLPSVFFGVATIIGIFFLARELWGKVAAVFAAFFLAVTPWHIHFSRIAFELISFPCLFIFGLLFMIRGLRYQGRNWLYAAIFIALTFYSYAIAFIFVPLFSLAFCVLYWRELWARRRALAIPASIFLILVTRVIVFKLVNGRDSNYFENVTWIFSDPTPIVTFFKYYLKFFSPSFLFRNGDPIIRHSVQVYGELPDNSWPLVIVALISLCIPISRVNLLILSWVLLYPLGATIMNEIPSASRSFIGSPIAALLVGHLIGRVYAVFARSKHRRLATFVRFTLGPTVAALLVFDLVTYMSIYFNEWYPRSARGTNGFQFGYRDALAYVKEHKHEYSNIRFTAVDVNVPYIFTYFYLQLPPPKSGVGESDNPYPEIWPDRFDTYDFDTPLLFIGRESDYRFFSDFTERKRIIGPDNVTEFIIGEVRGHKKFLTNWSVRGLFPSPIANRETVDPATLPPRPEFVFNDTVEGLGKKVSWVSYAGLGIKLDFNFFYRDDDPFHPGNPEEACAEGITFINVPKGLDGAFEYFGTQDHLAVWVDSSEAVLFDRLPLEEVLRAPVFLSPGWHSITFRSCESYGDWDLAFRLTQRDGRDVEDFEQQSTPPNSP